MLLYLLQCVFISLQDLLFLALYKGIYCEYAYEKLLARVFGFYIIPVKTHGHVSRKMHSTQCAIYRKQKIADFNPLYLLNYLADFYQTYIFYAPHIHDLTYQI